MNQKKKKLPTSTIALIGVGILVAILIFNVLSIGKVNVLVAKSDIPVRTKVTADMLTVKNVSEDAIPAGALKEADKAKIVGKVSSKDVIAGLPIVASQMLGEETKSVITAQIPEGFIGYTVPVTNVTGYGPAISKFEKVNVTAVMKYENNFNPTVTLIQNAQVLDVIKDPNNEKNLLGVSIAIPMEKAADISFALAKGEVSVQVVPYGYKEMTTNGMSEMQFLKKYVNNAGSTIMPNTPAATDEAAKDANAKHKSTDTAKK